jgi:hypothetical protein
VCVCACVCMCACLYVCAVAPVCATCVRVWLDKWPAGTAQRCNPQAAAHASQVRVWAAANPACPCAASGPPACRSRERSGTRPPASAHSRLTAGLASPLDLSSQYREAGAPGWVGYPTTRAALLPSHSAARPLSSLPARLPPFSFLLLSSSRLAVLSTLRHVLRNMSSDGVCCCCCCCRHHSAARGL